MKGIIVYNAESLKRNGFFADKLVSELAALDIDAVVTDEQTAARRIRNVDFVVMRVYNEALSAKFEAQGKRVFNNGKVARICNDKWKTYEFMRDSGLRLAPTVKADECDFPFPRVVKARHGHGGSEVFMTYDADGYKKVLSSVKDDMIAQPPTGRRGLDLRVYVIGNRPVVAMLRKSDTDFRSNFSLGGSAERYELGEKENELVERIAKLFDFDFAGIDFLLGEDGLILNEIEDIVGCRMVYTYTDIDIIRLYAKHISDEMQKISHL